jgi:hypothetical protein
VAAAECSHTKREIFLGRAERALQLGGSVRIASSIQPDHKRNSRSTQGLHLSSASQVASAAKILSLQSEQPRIDARLFIREQRPRGGHKS